MQSNSSILLPSIHALLSKNNIDEMPMPIQLPPISNPFSALTEKNNCALNQNLLNNIQNINRMNALNNINNINININNDNFNFHSNNSQLNLQLPICKTTSRCQTKVKIVDRKICLKRKTIFKTVMENDDPSDLSPSDESPDNERHITSICLQYYEVPLPDDFCIKSLESISL